MEATWEDMQMALSSWGPPQLTSEGMGPAVPQPQKLNSASNLNRWWVASRPADESPPRQHLHSSHLHCSIRKGMVRNGGWFVTQQWKVDTVFKRGEEDVFTQSPSGMLTVLDQASSLSFPNPTWASAGISAPEVSASLGSLLANTCSILAVFPGGNARTRL